MSSVVDVVGANPTEHASAAIGIIKLISEALIKSLLELDEIPITEMVFFFAYLRRFNNSLLFPELDMMINISFFETAPKSP